MFYRKLPTYNPQFAQGKPYRHVRKIKISQSSSGGGVSSVKGQRSSDAATWNDVYTATLVSGINNITLPASVSSPFWRVLATSARIDGLTAYGWGVNDITMHEVANDINLYDPISGVSKHYDGSTWDNVVRVFVGEAVVDSAGNVVSYTTYPYNKSKLKALHGEDSDDVVTLGQFTRGSGWCKAPNGVVIQQGQAAIASGGRITFPIEFINYPIVLAVVTGVVIYNSTYVVVVGATFKDRVTLWHGGGATSFTINWIAIG